MGFSARETMSGHHEFVDGRGKHPFAFRVTWGTDRLRSWLKPGDDFMRSDLEGEVLVGGMGDWAPCKGWMKLDYAGNRRIRYSFEFEHAGVAYHYQGDKVEIRPWNLPTSHTTCVGTLTERDTGKLVSTSVVRFKLRDLPRLLTAIRPR